MTWLWDMSWYRIARLEMVWIVGNVGKSLCGRMQTWKLEFRSSGETLDDKKIKTYFSGR